MEQPEDNTPKIIITLETGPNELEVISEPCMFIDLQPHYTREMEQRIKKMFPGEDDEKTSLPCFLSHFGEPGRDELQAAPKITWPPTRRRGDSRSWKLHRPTLPVVRDFVFQLRLENLDHIDDDFTSNHPLIQQLGLDELRNYLYFHELMVFVFSINKINIRGSLPFPCCTCGGDEQQEEIPQIIYYGWREKTIDGILNNVQPSRPYILLSIAACSYLLPEIIYLELCSRLPEVNTILAKLHAAMIKRQKINDARDWSQSEEIIDCYEEGTVLSLLEEYYDYTSHGGSIGSCWLNQRDRLDPPLFVIDGCTEAKKLT